MTDRFFEAPILNSPYDYPGQHWELDQDGQPTNQVLEFRRQADFIVQVDDGRGPDDLRHLIVEIKGDRGEDAKDKASTMRNYWVPGVNNLGTYGRWDFAEFRAVFEIESEFNQVVAAAIGSG